MTRPLAALVALALLACTAAPPAARPVVAPAPSASAAPPAPVASAETPDAPFRQQPPPPGPEGSFQAPVPFDHRLPSGLRILLIENHTTPVVSLQLVINRGTEQDAAAAALLAPMLLQGTARQTAFELSDTLEELGARYRVMVDDDAMLLNVTVLAQDAERALGLMADVMRNATLPASELTGLRERKIQALAAEQGLPRVLLHRAVAELLYPPSHPYRTSALLDEATLRRTGRAELRRFQQRHVQPDAVTLVVAGDITRAALLGAATSALGGWRGKAATARPAPTPAPFEAPSVLLVDLPSAAQTSLALCAVGAPYRAEDHDTLLVLGTLLTRRLNANLRGRRGYTYGVSSQFTFRHGPGPFWAGGDVVSGRTAEAIQEVLREVAALREQPPAHDELSQVKTIVSALSARFETAESSVVAMTPMAVYGLGDDDFLTLRVRLQLVSRETIQQAARTYLAPGRLRLALVGDAASIEAPVRALNLGAVEVRKLAPAVRRAPPAPLDPPTEPPPDVVAPSETPR